MERKFDASNPMQVGGQAVLEGVMMRAPGVVATAVRRADGSIALRKDPYVSLAERNRLFKLPVLRGAVGLIEMLIIGVRTLNYSAEIALQDADGGNGRESGISSGSRKSRGENLRLALTVAVALIAGITLFFVTPLLLTTAIFNVAQDPFRFNGMAGVIRMGLLLLYLGAISAMKDVRRLFEYHGAEHKAVFSYERGALLAPEAAARQSRFHPRCGTSFLLIVILIAVLLFGLLDALLILWLGGLTLPIRLATHLPLVPLVGGVSYECIKFSARRSDTIWGRLIVAPGLWLQMITTREPDEGELEVALTALRSALGVEAPTPPEQVQAGEPVMA